MLNWLYEIVATIILAWHKVFGSVFGAGSGAAWALSIVFLTITLRLLLFPLFVKQIRSQRAMQALQPKIKELQKRHQGDRETLNKEMMALYKEHGANPLAGCLPLVLQLPVFFSLFHVLNGIKPNDKGVFSSVAGIDVATVEQAAKATIFGAPIASAFTSSQDLITSLGGNLGVTKVLAVVMIVLMGATTFLTQKQMIARNGPMEGQQAQIQKIMLYVLPFSFAIFGFNFPLGVLLYWLTTNVWSMGQQFVVIRRMPVAAGGGGLGAVAAKKDKGAVTPELPSAAASESTSTPPATGLTKPTPPTGKGHGGAGRRPGASTSPGAGAGKGRRKGRPGGRR